MDNCRDTEQKYVMQRPLAELQSLHFCKATANGGIQYFLVIIYENKSHNWLIFRKDLFVKPESESHQKGLISFSCKTKLILTSYPVLFWAIFAVFLALKQIWKMLGFVQSDTIYFYFSFIKCKQHNNNVHLPTMQVGQGIFILF